LAGGCGAFVDYETSLISNKKSKDMKWSNYLSTFWGIEVEYKIDFINHDMFWFNFVLADIVKYKI
jgi:hypothetical protein